MMADELASPDFYQATIEEIPLGRVLQPHDMVGAVAFLCSALSEMITGQVIIVDGGRTLTRQTGNGRPGVMLWQGVLR